MPLTTASAMTTSASVRRRNMRKSQSDIGMSTIVDNFDGDADGDDLFFVDGPVREIALPRLKRQNSERTSDYFDLEKRRRNKENGCIGGGGSISGQAPRVNKAESDGWLRVRHHVVRKFRTTSDSL